MKHDNGYDRYGCNDCICITKGKFFYREEGKISRKNAFE